MADSARLGGRRRPRERCAQARGGELARRPRDGRRAADNRRSESRVRRVASAGDRPGAAAGSDRRDGRLLRQRAWRVSLARTLTDPELVRIARSLVTRPGSPGEHDPEARPAAVALVLRAVEMKGLELLFIRRAEYADDPWSGQVAFPGGRHESGDESLERTAIRETWEETGIDLAASGT